MRATVALLAILGTCACGKAGAPTGPSTVNATPALASSAVPASIATFAMTGQLIQGTYHYWPTLIIDAGSTAITLKRISFALPGTLTRDAATLDWHVNAGDTFAFGTVRNKFEVLGSDPATSATVTVAYADADGQARELTGTTSIAAVESTPTTAALEISNFVVTRWQEPYEWDYWPRFTVTETSGGAVGVTITRIELTLLDMSTNSRVPPSFGSWPIPSGGSIRLFDEWSYGEPAFYLSSSRQTDRVMVTLSYVDADGRPGDVTAIAHVSEDGLPPAPQ